MIIRRYSELVTIPTFEERFEYLKLGGRVGQDTFGFDSVFRRMFLKSKEWRDVRHHVIVRDLGCDLGVEGYDIRGPITIHHMNPIDLDDIRHNTDFLMNPEYLISTAHLTHNAIHYGDSNLLMKDPIIRTPNDTCPWKR